MELLEQFTMENEGELNRGYFLRSKRRKLENGNEEVTLEKAPPLGRKKKCPILELPAEILSYIFKLIPNQQLSNSIRLVNRRFKNVAEEFLNTTFKLLEGKLKYLLKSTVEALQTAQDDLEIKCFCRLINMLEILKFQQSVVICSIWRYVYNRRYLTYRSSMYAGTLLDTYEDFLYKFTHSPNQLYATAILRDYSMPVEVNSIIQMTKTFCLHFEKINEESANTSLLVSGCKLLDLLDCAPFAQRDVMREEADAGGVFRARYSYYFNNSWFVALNIRSDKQMTWKQKQRMMHMRIRRILLAHTEMFMQQYQYERELLLRTDPFVKVKKPSNNVYTGYGDIQDKFFYYGVMNDGAYVQKFHPDEQAAEEAEEIINQPEDPPQMNLQNQIEDGSSDTNDALQEAPYLGVIVDAKVECPLQLAPLRYLDENERLDPLKRAPPSPQRSRNDVSRRFVLKLEFRCVGARHPRLPTAYSYSFKHKL